MERDFSWIFFWQDCGLVPLLPEMVLGLVFFLTSIIVTLTARRDV